MVLRLLEANGLFNEIMFGKFLGRSCVINEVLQTVITEIEAFLNDRQSTYASSKKKKKTISNR